MNRCAWAELVWDDQLGLGYLPARDAGVYDAAYWAKYVAYAATPLGRDLTAARLALARRHVPDAVPLLDVGIGCGAFVEARGLATTWGYDVNPTAVAWLLKRDRFVDPLDRGRPAPPHASFWDALEHLPDPAALLERVTGVALVAIPIFHDRGHVLRSRHLRPDEHRWYFTRDGLVTWFRRRGFALCEEDDAETRLGREDIRSFAFRREAR